MQPFNFNNRIQKYLNDIVDPQNRISEHLAEREEDLHSQAADNFLNLLEKLTHPDPRDKSVRMIDAGCVKQLLVDETDSSLAALRKEIAKENIDHLLYALTSEHDDSVLLPLLESLRAVQSEIPENTKQELSSVLTGFLMRGAEVRHTTAHLLGELGYRGFKILGPLAIAHVLVPTNTLCYSYFNSQGDSELTNVINRFQIMSRRYRDKYQSSPEAKKIPEISGSIQEKLLQLFDLTIRPEFYSPNPQFQPLLQRTAMKSIMKLARDCNDDRASLAMNLSSMFLEKKNVEDGPAKVLFLDSLGDIAAPKNLLSRRVLNAWPNTYIKEIFERKYEAALTMSRGKPDRDVLVASTSLLPYGTPRHQSIVLSALLNIVSIESREALDNDRGPTKEMHRAFCFISGKVESYLENSDAKRKNEVIQQATYILQTISKHNSSGALSIARIATNTEVPDSARIITAEALREIDFSPRPKLAARIYHHIMARLKKDNSSLMININKVLFRACDSLKAYM